MEQELLTLCRLSDTQHLIDVGTIATTNFNQAVTLTFDLQCLIRSSVGAGGYSLHKWFMRNVVHKI